MNQIFCAIGAQSLTALTNYHTNLGFYRMGDLDNGAKFYQCASGFVCALEPHQVLKQIEKPLAPEFTLCPFIWTNR